MFELEDNTFEYTTEKLTCNKCGEEQNKPYSPLSLGNYLIDGLCQNCFNKKSS